MQKMVSHNRKKQNKTTQPQLRVVRSDFCEGPVSSLLLTSDALPCGAFSIDRTPPSAWTTAERFFFIQSDVGKVCLQVLWDYFTPISEHNYMIGAVQNCFWLLCEPRPTNGTINIFYMD